jgi:flagellar basal body-associated protein FliL
MVCPACGTFQPRAEVCKKCGIIIAKAAKPAAMPAPRVTASSKSGNPILVLIILAVIIALPVLGYLLFTGGENAETVMEGARASAKPAAKSQIERIASVNPGTANNLQRSEVQSKLSALRMTINLYNTENDAPLSDAEGLEKLVARGMATAADITDPWGHAFVYRMEPATGEGFVIRLSSNGPDGMAGTADDIGI